MNDVKILITQTSVDETVSLISKLIQNKRVNPPGNELKSIKYSF